MNTREKIKDCYKRNLITYFQFSWLVTMIEKHIRFHGDDAVDSYVNERLTKEKRDVTRKSDEGNNY